MDHKIGIIGQGFVGNSIRLGMIEDYPKLLTYDINPALRNTNSLANFVEYSNIIFVCVPTPMKKNGECYTGIVEKVVDDIEMLTTKNFHRFCVINLIPLSQRGNQRLFPAPLWDDFLLSALPYLFNYYWSIFSTANVCRMAYFKVCAPVCQARIQG